MGCLVKKCALQHRHPKGNLHMHLYMQRHNPVLLNPSTTCYLQHTGSSQPCRNCLLYCDSVSRITSYGAGCKSAADSSTSTTGAALRSSGAITSAASLWRLPASIPN